MRFDSSCYLYSVYNATLPFHVSKPKDLLMMMITTFPTSTKQQQLSTDTSYLFGGAKIFPRSSQCNHGRYAGRRVHNIFSAYLSTYINKSAKNLVKGKSKTNNSARKRTLLSTTSFVIRLHLPHSLPAVWIDRGWYWIVMMIIIVILCNLLHSWICTQYTMVFVLVRPFRIPMKKGFSLCDPKVLFVFFSVGSEKGQIYSTKVHAAEQRKFFSFHHPISLYP